MKTKMRDCSCAKCVACCERAPGWMTPEEAERAIEAGTPLMLDYWLDGAKAVLVLCPAAVGLEGRRAPNTSEMGGALGILSGASAGRCALLVRGRCSIHDTGHKPIECRKTMGCQEGGIRRKDIKELWRPRQDVARRWMASVGMSEEELEECY